MHFSLGKDFKTYTDLMEKIEKFKKTNFVDLYVRDSRSIEAAQKRLSKKLNKELKYYELKFTCVAWWKEILFKRRRKKKDLVSIFRFYWSYIVKK